MEAKAQMIQEQPKRPMSVDPRKFNLWLFMATVVMLFGAYLSAILVAKAEAGWAEYQLPDSLWFTSGIIVLSSIFLQLAYRSAKKDNLSTLKIYMSITMGLGLLFLAGQYYAWTELVAMKVYFSGDNLAGSFFYVISGLHGVHLIGGIVYLIIVFVNTFQAKVHSKNLNRMEMCATYWHFLGGLWLILFIFLFVNI